ncbi:hypothetical protein TSUD_326800 [Trifolium subterraneum]|uniref:Uncharacterized protein n=1 Tax=Trifolium subterraneum TaxID=3900 RepID=A0A2Z6LU76_TRISU|nr:hypothetical protein TSUD_326800 [Trifolium subterraneum]
MSSYNSVKSPSMENNTIEAKLLESGSSLGSFLEPGKPPLTNEEEILIMAARMVKDLRSQAQKLRETNSSLIENIEDLKSEKNELLEEMERLKAEKERLEQLLAAKVIKKMK